MNLTSCLLALETVYNEIAGFKNPIRVPSLGDSVRISGLHPAVSPTPMFGLFLPFSAFSSDFRGGGGIRMILLNISSELFSGILQ